MIDIHPPEHTPHTWRDFSIHIATITIGLLIAIGLEQSVEAVHHAQERRELIADIHHECESNLNIADADVLSYGANRDWQAAAVAAIEDARPSAGFVTVTLPPRPSMQPTQAPSDAVWSVAKSNGKVALLPENLAEIYDRLDHISGEFSEANRQTNQASQSTHAVAARLRIPMTPGSTVHLSVVRADELAAALAISSARDNASAIWSAYWGGGCRAVLDGVQSRDAMWPYMSRHAVATK